MIDTIMLFAAGFGSRMRHLTNNQPKSLIKVLEKPILHYSLELCKKYPFKRIIINTHYLHEQIFNSIYDFQKNNPDFPKINIIYEEELLETGGAIKNISDIVGDKHIFTLNTDTIIQSKHNLFQAMCRKWDPKVMDFLLLMQPIDKTVGYTGLGDFELDQNNKIIKPDIEGSYSYIYAGLQILKPEIIYQHPLNIFSLREYHLNNPNVYGTVVDKIKWYHATRPEDIVDIEFALLKHV